jgi:O-antigen ligase/polysaccharide polymerase Wzy-like membrane protein
MVAWTGVCLLVLVAPFEALQPLVRLPGQSLTIVELALLAVLAAWLAAAVLFRQRPPLRTPLTLPWLTVLFTSAVAAAVAPADRVNAFHMVARFGLAFGVFLVTVSGVSTPDRLRRVVISGAVVGIAISVLVVLEFLGNGLVLRMLRIFRPGVAVVGSQVRAAGPFQYPTIASMYLEIVFAFTLGLLPDAVAEKRWWAVAAVMAVLAIVAEGIVLTFTRAGLLTMAAAVLVVGAFRCRRSGFDRATWSVALVGLIVAVEIVSSRSTEMLRVRMMTESQDDWYQAEIDAPLAVSLKTGAVTIVPIQVTNNGLVTWDPAADHPFRFAYHLLREDGVRVAEWEGLRTLFPSAVPPGETVGLRVSVRAPGEPGRYRLLWDIEQQDQLWFSSEPRSVLVETNASVEGPLVSTLPISQIQFIPHQKARPGRAVLWRAALRMFAAHPLTGVGPDNFRLEYGTYAGIANADPRVHSNNMYLEVMAGTGILGGLAFLWLGWRASGRIFTLWLSGKETLGAGVAAAAVAIAAHGVVDAFLGFTATYILIAITFGLTVASTSMGEAHAHRV